MKFRVHLSPPYIVAHEREITANRKRLLDVSRLLFAVFTSCTYLIEKRISENIDSRWTIPKKYILLILPSHSLK